MKENIRKYLELTEVPTPPMHLEEDVMERIRTYKVKQEKRMQSLRWGIILITLSIVLFVLFFLYGESVFKVLSAELSLPDLSQQMPSTATLGGLFFLLAFVDPILSLYVRRRYKKAYGKQ
ncbi:MAG: hypothetical protein AAF849_19740 [Bacteroidota bacterium]